MAERKVGGYRVCGQVISNISGSVVRMIVFSRCGWGCVVEADWKRVRGWTE